MNQNKKKTGFIKTYPITFLLIISNLFIYIIQEVSGDSSNPVDLVKMGARYDIYVANGDWWRFITPNFLHIGFTHLLLNLAGLWIFGMLVEKDFSKSKYLLIYFFCGISSNVFSYSSGSWFGFTCGPVGAGASGAIFGLLGAYASYLIVNKNVLGKQGKDSLISIGAIIFINVIYGAAASGVDHIAHISGIICGLAIGWLLSPAKQLVILPNEMFENSILVNVKRNNLSLIFIVSFVFLIIITFMAYNQRTQDIAEFSRFCI
ncbi:MAG: rhomboid family intramembrane serine protease [SAR202 cluster bacterium]|nr:rhomboid family intramembrane serine protease [SAR202 cluster bacterium]OUU77393.1 MAG: hypothetical protein CBC30_01740 [Chloroflexi bacterium TMED70]RZP17689.1 MAG: rhomboid family intramembrane serine protease [Chloroflexota bacterium]|tara:strand:+ start:156 stop:941 length:786 start_codon:yes stop_codon:yes gene_type:complete